MRTAARPLALVAVAAAALALSACSSNNKGKIEGKWKLVSAPGVDEAQLKMMEAVKAYLFMEFRDGTMTIGAESSDPEVQKMLAEKGEKTTISCKYKLLSGDKVEFYDLPKELQEKGGGLFGKNKDRAQTSVKISGDEMTMTDSDGKTGKLVRVK